MYLDKYFLIKNLLSNTRFTLCYDDDNNNPDGGGNPDGNPDGGGNPDGNPAVTDPPHGGGSGGGGGNNGNPNPDIRTNPLSREQQDYFNKKINEEKKKWQAQQEKTIRELEKLKQSSTITAKEKEALQSRIDEMQAQFLSKEELLKKEKEKLAKEHMNTVQSLSSERDTWRTRFETSSVSRALLDAAHTHDAFNPEQIVAMLEKHARLVEEVDQDGKGTGVFIPRVRLTDFDQEGKPVTLDLTAEQAVKRMKDTPDKYGNLFKSGVAGGVGGNGSANGSRGKNVDFSKMSPEEYMKWRKDHPKLDVEGAMRH